MLRSYMKSQFRGKNTGSSIEEISVSGTTREYYNGYSTLSVSNFPSIIHLLVVAYGGRLKTEENFKLLALKVVAVACESCSLTRGFQCSDLAEKLLVFWKTGR